MLQRPVITLYIASSNRGKLHEFATAAAPSGIAVLPLPGLGAMPEPPENADTFTGNADLKALAYSRLAPGLLVLADDSGLQVDALHGRPGVLSARFADTLNFPATAGVSKDARNLQCLLQELARVDDPNRQARFRCALSLARKGEVLLRANGVVEGEILDAPRGAHGFGYDPVFLVPARSLTLAELSPADKWALSHRGHAFRNLLAQLSSTNLIQK